LKYFRRDAIQEVAVANGARFSALSSLGYALARLVGEILPNLLPLHLAQLQRRCGLLNLGRLTARVLPRPGGQVLLRHNIIVLDSLAFRRPLRATRGVTFGGP